MAKLRPAACYRRVKRPNTRVSKYRELSYVKGVPGSKVKKFDMGNILGNYDYLLKVVCKEPLQIRHNALESFRNSANKQLDKKCGPNNYYFKLHVFPHQVMRQHSQANFAGADRFTSGMAHSYGKALGTAAVVKVDQTLSSVKVSKANLQAAKDSLHCAKNRLPCLAKIQVISIHERSNFISKKNVVQAPKSTAPKPAASAVKPAAPAAKPAAAPAKK